MIRGCVDVVDVCEKAEAGRVSVLVRTVVCDCGWRSDGVTGEKVRGCEP
jgi:hypothetical protein